MNENGGNGREEEAVALLTDGPDSVDASDPAAYLLACLHRDLALNRGTCRPRTLSARGDGSSVGCIRDLCENCSRAGTRRGAPYHKSDSAETQ